jgi:hypothetical protein
VGAAGMEKTSSVMDGRTDCHDRGKATESTSRRMLGADGRKDGHFPVRGEVVSVGGWVSAAAQRITSVRLVAIKEGTAYGSVEAT